MKQEKMALKNLIYKLEVGSNLYGTTTETSDRDYMGVFIPNEEYVLGNQKCDQVQIRTNPSDSGRQNTNADTDTVIYALPKYIKLLTANNPTVLETLYAPERNIKFCNEFGKKILENHALFVSKKVKWTYLGYAYTQKKALTHKKERFEVLGGAYDKLLDLEKQGVEFLDERLNLLSNLREDKTWGAFEKGQPISDVKGRIEEEINKYGHRLDLIRKFGFDTKFASHLIRLLDEGLELLVEGTLVLPLRQNNILRDIKLGKYPLDQILKMAEDREKLVDEAYVKSSLQHTPNLKEIEKLQIDLLKLFLGYHHNAGWEITTQYNSSMDY